MIETMEKTFCVDGDCCKVLFVFDEVYQQYFGEYPDFEESPRYTPNHRPWVTAMQEGCKYGINLYVEHGMCMDCGSCKYFVREQEKDLIGVCFHEMKIEHK